MKKRGSLYKSSENLQLSSNIFHVFMSSIILIYCIFLSRPLNDQAKESHAFLTIQPAAAEKSNEITVVGKDSKEHKFCFDGVFNGYKQNEVYKLVALPLVEKVVDGYTCSLLVYGPEGSGKTFTLEGKRIDKRASSWSLVYMTHKIFYFCYF